MPKLSPHFTTEEFEHSNKAIELGVDNTMPAGAIINAKALCVNVLEPIRAHYNAPINISSGYRNAKVNKAVGGAKASQHTTGQAVDFTVRGYNTREVFEWCVANIDYDQIIYEVVKNSKGIPIDIWIHISYNIEGNRKEALTAIRTQGIKGTRYKPFRG
jgi:zinc D-Ala-D-Ala carboxypeptidase